MGNISSIKYAVISVIGPHAGESENEIFNRKIQDIPKCGRTYWLMKSFQAKPEMVQKLCSEAEAKKTSCYCLFIEASSKGGAIPTKITSSAKCYSVDKLNWHVLPFGLSPVTGKIDNNAYALVLDQLKMVDDVKIDLWEYADSLTHGPVKIIRGASTICAVREDTENHHDKIKSRNRKVIAGGKLCDPFCVYLK